jgi:hypothetical protein
VYGGLVGQDGAVMGMGWDGDKTGYIYQDFYVTYLKLI